MRIDPRDFIMGPFETCPNCNQPQLGTEKVGPESQAQRCKNCLFRSYRPLPPIRKKVLYLDQFFISNVAKAQKGNVKASADMFWIDAYVRLKRLIRLQVVACPDSPTHDRESSMSPDYEAFKQVFESLSAAQTFSHVIEIRGKQIQTALTAWLKGEKPVHDFEPSEVIDGDIHGWWTVFT